MLVTAGGALAGAGVLGAKRAAHSTLPQVSGVVRVPGLHDEVSIDRDAWGIPHIAAGTVDDLFFANGFVHAQDRLWQMELNRRVGSGRLSELFGERTIEADRLMRYFGFRRVAEQEARLLDGITRAALEAYCRGVNYFLANRLGGWPLEFSLLRLLPPPHPRWRPEPWNVADVLVYSKVMALGLCVNWSAELVRAQIVARLGPDRTAALEPIYGRQQPLVIPGAEVPAGAVRRLADAYAELVPFLEASGVGAGGFSNNWVVDGTRTASGKPLLANDPHLAVQMPSIWYELELNGPGYNVAGASLPGVPGVLIGHNRKIAWGVTAAALDVQDIVIEQINPDHPGQYLYQGAWRDGDVVQEEIAVRGRQQPVRVDVLITHHGPVISPVLEGEQRALALRWTALQPGVMASSLLALNMATTWQEFATALRAWDAPPLNFVYADVEGNIGYYTPGVVPIRLAGDGALPVPGWTGDYEWIGTVPFDDLPHAFNPPSHQIVTANNRLVGADYPYNLGNEWLPGYRAQRIADMLEGRSNLTVEDFKRMQLDLRSLPGLEAQRVLATLEGREAREQELLAEAGRWDGNLTAASVGGCICLVFQHHFLRAVFGPILGDLTEAYLGTGHSMLTPRTNFYGRALPLLYELAGRRDDHWFARMGANGQTWDGVLRAALGQTMVFLSTRLGPDSGQWRWGRLNRITFAHPLGDRLPLDRMFNRGPFEVGGDDHTVAAAALPLYSPHDRNGWITSYRQIVDLERLWDSVSMHTTGQSGHQASEHYADMITPWREGRYHPMSLPVGDMRRELGGHLVLQPPR
jgi:penicillin amidase